ncbi:hypothetical protein OAF35_06765 [Verrucomicrobiales bacterium]|nr:hypothetical protein [Verrucomicrobiales bacterium]
MKTRTTTIATWSYQTLISPSLLMTEKEFEELRSTVEGLRLEKRIIEDMQATRRRKGTAQTPPQQSNSK